MKISVVIPTHNRADALALTLSHLAQQQFNEPWEVLVVNNLSTDNTVELVSGMSFPVPLRLVSEDTPGPAAARNAGAFQALGEYLIFIDNDILVEPHFLQLHLDALQHHPGTWIVGNNVNLPEQEKTPFGRFRKSLAEAIPRDTAVRATDFITTANLSLPKADFEALGGFDENFFVASGEDRELMLRARLRGIKLLLHPGIVAIHNDWAGTTIRDYCIRQRTYTQTEPLFWRKHPADYPRPQLVIENSPPSWKNDSISLFGWKCAKQILGTRAVQSLLFSSCAVIERMAPVPRLLWPLYRLAIAGAIYRGFQEGLTLTNTGEASKPTSTSSKDIYGLGNRP